MALINGLSAVGQRKAFRRNIRTRKGLSSQRLQLLSKCVCAKNLAILYLDIMGEHPIQLEGKQMQFCECQRCGKMFQPDIPDDGEISVQDKLCYYCEQDAVGEWKEKRRERIARDNEY
jgi:hypothetical protein